MGRCGSCGKKPKKVLSKKSVAFRKVKSATAQKPKGKN